MSKTEPSFFADAGAFRAWLEANAASASELLVGFHKVGSGRPCMSWSESVDEALCFGWIDGVRRRIDEDSYSIRFTPRKPSSIWSVVNIAKMEKLRAEGKMTPAGEAAFAQRSEARSGVYSHERLDVPELTQVELERFRQEGAAWTYFETVPPGYRKTVLHWITNAKKDETRAGRLDKLIQACAAGTRLR
ncbi:YdeI/OmpD-associated family protein [Massilia sp. IC2-477]|uniref:YdeI/OmpD-associated family protein n=1 Tax=Massilia sp. IC2-477 TaxID=2887198 RepID=UPI001D10DF68|nr:YdeI/OmpD-associated family protein [Massilia sp. IC2-477]MCC2957203.1 YdeI/OmpD-associated family protein [Massilia sp. IC2-477]